MGFNSEFEGLTNLMHKFLFYNEFIIRLYMFRTLCVHHQKVKSVLYSVWHQFLIVFTAAMLFSGEPTLL